MTPLSVLAVRSGEKTRSAVRYDTRDRAGLISRFAASLRLKSTEPGRTQTYSKTNDRNIPL
jgi:hypothetical protein